VLVKGAPTITNLSVDQFRERYGQPETVSVSRTDCKELPLSVPSQVVLPLDLGKKAQEFTLRDAAGLVLCDFGEAFAPVNEQRLGRECNTPAVNKAPEAFFEPGRALGQSSDVWSLGVAIWEILGMKAIFSESEPEAEVIAEQIDVLGAQYLPDHWRAIWDSQNDLVPLSDASEKSKAERETWPPLQDAFENFIQAYRRRRKTAGAFGEEETRMILCLIRGMLRFDPQDRLSTQEILKSDWMVEYALREL
jgi:serine/threonine-protein kinase SRPK3